jgi:hypothetical protein
MTRNNYAEQKKSDPPKCTLYDSIYREFYKMQRNLQCWKAAQVLPGDKRGKLDRKEPQKGKRNLFRDGGHVHYLHCGHDLMGTYICQN